MNHWLPSIVGFWLAGVIVLVCRLSLGLAGTRKLKSLAVEPAAAELQRILQSLRIRLGIDRTVWLLHSTRVHTPAVIGWLRPAILIPLGCMTGLSEEQIEAILAHELAHIRRHDYLVSLFQSLVETTLFYHPAVWWVSNHVRREREHCCDDLAVAVSGDRLAYAKALTILEEKRGSTMAGALAATGGVLKTRIARLLGVNPPPMVPRAAAIILLALAGTAAAALASLAPAPAHSAFSTKQTGGGRSGLYQKWLDQDVRWIITPEEKQAYLQLSTNEERRAFIIQFWDRRNPAPGNPVNAFKQEHYGRLAYANVHFAANGEPGWESDRGHAYIIFGPPDSIDAHTSGPDGFTKAYEVWHYRSIRFEGPARNKQYGSVSESPEIREDVDFRFVDDCNCGDYQLRSPWPIAAGAQSAAPADPTAERPSGAQAAALATENANGAERDNGRFDLSCTYYDKHTNGLKGTCETRRDHDGQYYCVNNNDKRQFEEQIGCEWKVNRARSLHQHVPELQGQ